MTPDHIALSAFADGAGMLPLVLQIGEQQPERSSTSSSDPLLRTAHLAFCILDPVFIVLLVVRANCRRFPAERAGDHGAQHGQSCGLDARCKSPRTEADLLRCPSFVQTPSEVLVFQLAAAAATSPAGSRASSPQRPVRSSLPRQSPRLANQD